MGMLSSHPNIVTVFDAGLTDDGEPYLIMEYMPDGSLDDRLADGALPWSEVADVGVKLAGALETAHEATVLHRDVKPANVLRSPFGEPCLSDFGLARFGGNAKTTGIVTATLLHAPPEIIASQPATPQSDVYSLASTLFTLLVGEAPFWQPTDDSLFPLLARIADDPVPDLRGRGVPPGLCEVIERGMSKAPEDRPPSAAAFGSALRDAQQQAGLTPTSMLISGQESVRAARQAATAATDANKTILQGRRATVEEHRTVPSSPPTTQRWRRRVAPVLVGLVGLAAVAIVAILALDDGVNDGGRRAAAPSATTAPPTSTAPATTGSPATTTVPSPGLSESAEGVLQNVPEDYRSSCQQLDGLPVGATGAVRCFPEQGADIVEYLAFESAVAMENYYVDEVDDGGVEPDTGLECPPESRRRLSGRGNAAECAASCRATGSRTSNGQTRTSVSSPTALERMVTWMSSIGGGSAPTQGLSLRRTTGTGSNIRRRDEPKRRTAHSEWCRRRRVPEIRRQRRCGAAGSGHDVRLAHRPAPLGLGRRACWCCPRCHRHAPQACEDPRGRRAGPNGRRSGGGVHRLAGAARHDPGTGQGRHPLPPGPGCG